MNVNYCSTYHCSFISGQCVSDPDLCESAPDYNKHIDEGKIKDKGLDRGLTVSFWIFITEKDVETNGKPDQNHQYIISSGGQVSSSRGFAVLYNADIKRFKVQLQTSQNVYSLDFDIPFADLKKQSSGGGTGPASGWVMVTFTWNSSGMWWSCQWSGSFHLITINSSSSNAWVIFML